MPSRRILKVAEAIREVVGMSILRDIQDPRVSGVTVTYVEVSGDMQQAKIYVSIMGTEKKQELCLKGLQNAAGFFQRKIADRIQTRYTPRVLFVLDKGVKNSILVAKILKEVLPPEDAAAPNNVSDSDSEEVQTSEAVLEESKDKNSEER